MIIKQEDKEWIEKVLGSLPFVSWDRFLDAIWGVNRIIHTFGWIEREKDNYKDFVCIEFDIKKKEVYLVSTSSKKYSKQINEIIGSSGHRDCQRVEDSFNVKNSIKVIKNEKG